MTATVVTETKRTKIREERLKKEALTKDDILDFVKQGKTIEARQALVFHTKPALFTQKTDDLLEDLSKDFKDTDKTNKMHYLVFITELALDLLSFKPQWNLMNKNLHGSQALPKIALDTMASKCKSVIATWGALDPDLEAELLKKWRSEAHVRLRVEGVADEDDVTRLVEDIVGETIASYLQNMADSFKRSNLRRVCDLRMMGETETEIGNDHSTNLEYALWLGASFVTTNPILVQIAWDLNPELWTPRVDDMITQRYPLKELSSLVHGSDKDQIDEAAELVTTDMTIEVVAENARLLRDIFLLTEGEKGLVCLQVNPLKHADAKAMVKEALFAYSKLVEKLGGVPNVVFKIPATIAGLEAAEELTKIGIGVTITVSFGLFQSLPFADVINQGNAIVSYLVVMNGRLAAPVVKDLEDLGVEYSKHGRWAGVAVAKRLYNMLYQSTDKGGRGYDTKKIRLIIASLRDYAGSFPDILELIGVSIITVFPNIRRAFDDQPMYIDPTAIEKPVKPQVIEGLLKSELFRQSYFIEEDVDELKPSALFFLEDKEKVIAYAPVNHTLGQFCDYRVKTKERIIERMRKVSRST